MSSIKSYVISITFYTITLSINIKGVVKMNKFNIDVGKKIFNARKSLNMSRVELGKKINLHESTIKRYEDGHTQNLDITKLKEFANALNISHAYLMGLELTDKILSKEDEIKNIIHEFTDDNNAVKKDILNSLLKVHDENTLKIISDIVHKFAECENLQKQS